MEQKKEALLEAMVSRHAPGVYERVRGACVGIAGLGGLGSTIAGALARTGVGRLILVDFDVVEPSNLNRQHYFLDQVGTPKAEALRENLQQMNPYSIYEIHSTRVTPENINTLFSEVEVLVEAFDRPEEKAMLLAHFRGAPVVAASGMGGYGSCENIGVQKLGNQIFVVGDQQSGMEKGFGMMAPRVGVVAHMQANLVLQLLMGTV